MAGKAMIYIGVAMIVAAVVYFGWRFTARGAYESAEYAVVESDGPFEIRAYPDLWMATTDMQFKSQGDDGSFMRLFRYISGANESEQKVAMTTPVFMEPDSPDHPGQMGFVIPRKITEQHVPEPTGGRVRLQQRAGGRFAVIHFAGRMSRETFQQAEEKLREWVKGKKLTAEGVAECAGYDPPWTPGPFRRNEVLIRLK